jgi:pilus assembly protein CpaE
MASILVCDAEPEFARTIAQAASPIDGAKVLYLSGLDDAVSHVVQGTSEVLLMGPGIATDKALKAAQTVRESSSSGVVLMMVKSAKADLLRRAMRAGIADVLEATAEPAEVEASLRSALALATRQYGTPAEAAQADLGEVITIFSTKGGVGKTVVATNVAVALAELGKSVVLVDLDLQFGDVGIVLGLEPTRTIIGAVQSAERLDESMLEGFLVDHPTGLKVLLAPTQPEDAEMVTASRIDRILRLLAAKFEYIVVDTPPTLDEAVLTALDRSSRIIAITMMDVASIKNSRISLQKLRQLGYNGSLVEVLLNRADSKVYLRPEVVEDAIGLPIKYRLPSDAQVPRSVNKGVPVVIEAPRSQPAKVLMETARSIVASREEGSADVS